VKALENPVKDPKDTAVHHPEALAGAVMAKIKTPRVVFRHLVVPATAATEKVKVTIQQDPLEKVRDTVVHHPVATEKAKVTLEIMAQVKGTQDLLEVMGKGKVMEAAVHGIRRLT